MTANPRAQLEAWLRYFDDLGISHFYTDRASPIELPAATGEVAKPRGYEVATPGSQEVQKEKMKPAWKISLPMAPAPTLFDAPARAERETLEQIRADIGDCTRCKLCRSRTNIVFGVGSEKAKLVFVGEGPGRDEDAQGIPFVGRAGQLLTQMIEAMGLKRADVYICNVVKCRPPENRTPEKDEIATCSPFLLRQLDAIRPRVIVCLGSVAAQLLLGIQKGISHYRGEWFNYRGAKLMATFHPAYLLRNPAEKGKVWADLQKVMAELGLAPPKRRA
jgi:DNA polymerase